MGIPGKYECRKVEKGLYLPKNKLQFVDIPEFKSPLFKEREVQLIASLRIVLGRYIR